MGDDEQPASRTRQVQLFMDAADDAAFVAALRERVSDLCLICGDRWPTPDPPVTRTNDDCADHFVYLWSPTVARDLPATERAGRYDGPKSGLVVQFQRSIVSEGVLRAGSLAVGWDPANKPMAKFVDAAWAALRKATSANLEVADGTPVRTHRIGFSAAAWSRLPGNTLRGCSVPVAYRLRQP